MDKWKLLSLLFGFTLACSLVRPPATVTPTASPVTPSPTVTQPSATATPLPTTEAPTALPTATATVASTAAPSATPAPTVVIPQNSIRVQFASGATSWATEGTLGRNEMRTYLVNAMQDQIMQVLVTSPQDQVYITLVGLSDGVPLARADMGATSWGGKLRLTQDYAITLSTRDGAPARYTLNITIPRRLRLDEQRTQLEYQSHLDAYSTHEYSLEVPEGQLMMVSLQAQQEIGLTIVGFADGNPYVRAVSGATSWQGFVPMTQDYLIKAVTAGSPTDYTLRVILPREIRFAAGAVSKEIKATLPATDVHTYVLQAGSKQTMELELKADGPVALELYSYEDGQPLLRADLGQTSWKGVLPATQHYILKVVSRHDKPLPYKLEVVIK